MNLEINLARDPFRNYTLYYAIAGLLGVLGLALLVVESRALFGAFSQRGELVAQIQDANQRAREDKDATKRLASFLDRAALKTGQEEATAVIGLMTRRTFDWGALFSELETVLPARVRLTSIQPSISDERSTISFNGVAKSLADQNELVQKLEASERFSEVFVVSQATEDSEITFAITAKYDRAGAGPSQPEPTKPARPAKPASGEVS